MIARRAWNAEANQAVGTWCCNESVVGGLLWSSELGAAMLLQQGSLRVDVKKFLQSR